MPLLKVKGTVKPVSTDYIGTCGRCKRSEMIYGVDPGKGHKERSAYAAGWQKVKKYGWVCSKCAGEP